MDIRSPSNLPKSFPFLSEIWHYSNAESLRIGCCLLLFWLLAQVFFSIKSLLLRQTLRRQQRAGRNACSLTYVEQTLRRSAPRIHEAETHEAHYHLRREGLQRDRLEGDVTTQLPRQHHRATLLPKLHLWRRLGR